MFSELLRIREFLVANEKPREKGLELRTGSPNRLTNIRLDYETDNDDNWENTVDNMLNIFSYDLADMLLNGDVNKTSDPLLNSIDGAYKRGLAIIKFEVPHFHLAYGFSSKRKVHEYTAYLTIYAEFGRQ
jgi:hypothetical protein